VSGKLHTPYDLAGLALPNRLVMSPMTRSRAMGNEPNAMMTRYYAQRASAGLIIAEGTQTSPFAKGFPGVPGIYADSHIAGWREVTQAVHAAGGRIFLQLWHCGRISHPRHQPGGAPPIAPSAIRANAFSVLDDGTRLEVETPRALETAELPGLIGEFVSAARNALRAGFDGVEIHAANGYLLHQFLAENVNRRTDGYGTTIDGRIRFVVEVAEAVAAAVGSHRTGIRLSPVNRYNDVADSDPNGTYAALLRELSRVRLAYANVTEGEGQADRDPRGFDFATARRLFRGAWIVNNLYDQALAEAALASGYADLIAFGRPFLANPDLVERYRIGAPLNAVDYKTAYRGGEAGYIDYPSLAST
jgi:N-ethylmaleimide reductase